MSKRLKIMMALSLLIAVGLYTGGYIWARSTGLFVGGVETFVPYGGTPSGEYEVKSIGRMSLGIHPDAYETESEVNQAIMRLREDQALSRRLWRYYWPLAELEEIFR